MDPMCNLKVYSTAGTHCLSVDNPEEEAARIRQDVRMAPEPATEVEIHKGFTLYAGHIVGTEIVE